MTLNVHPNDERQVALEQRMVQLGEQRYLKQRENSDESETAPAQAVMAKTVGRLSAAIAEQIETYNAGKAGRYARTVLATLSSVDPEALAYIAIRRTLSGAARAEKMTTMCVGIAAMIEEHVDMRTFQKHIPKLAAWWADVANKSGHEQHRRKVLRAGARQHVDPTNWNETDKLKAGSWLLEMIEEHLGLVERCDIQKNGRNLIEIRLRPEVVERFDELHGMLQSLQPFRLPMVSAPLDWTTPWDGGYYTINQRLMKNASREQLDDLGSTSMPEVYDAVNALQRVPWQINRDLLEVVEALAHTPAGVPGIPGQNSELAPVRPADIPRDCAISDLTDEQQSRLKDWRKLAAAWHDKEIRRTSKLAAFGQRLWVAREFAAEDVIYYPYEIDTRGRVYTAPTDVSPQSDDLGKALLRFATRKPLGEGGAYWLAVHVANCWGEDKIPFDDRVQWVLDNEEMIADVGLNPADTLEQWACADSPWQFLAAALEWASYVRGGCSEDFMTAIPVGMDGSCSGLQHYSAVLLDPVGGAAVNLVPSVGVADIYTEVANRVNVCLDDPTCDDDLLQWRGKVDRKIVKQPCMTYAYSATLDGMRKQIFAAAMGKAPEARPAGDMNHNCVALAPVVRKCIEETVIAAAEAMAWLQAASQVMSSHGLDLRWTAPNGLPVRQAERKVRTVRSPVWYGGQRIRLRLAEDTHVLDKARQKSAFAPNWIHSLDASHLTSVVTTGLDTGLEHFAMVHDSFGVHAGDVDVLNSVIRKTFVEQYSINRLASLAEELRERLPEGADLPPLPMTGNLDLDSVQDSEYFFA